MDVVTQFLNHYIREIDFYEKTAKICAQICESELDNAGIRAIVTYRVKRVERLKDKLIQRNGKKNYESIEDIYKDIVDLAGVRIALYFPSDKEKIDRFIKSKFDVREVKKFPNNSSGSTAEGRAKNIKYEKLFSGYHATHYRVNLLDNELSSEESKYCQANIEIQVASVLMHAWSEVEHDLVYKPLNGALSVDEYEILDELNGLILAGELALKRLHKAVKERLTQNKGAFTSHYELASFIYGRIASNPAYNDIEDMVMGRADLMYKFLKYAGLNDPQYVDQYIGEINPKCEESTVVEQIIDKMLEEDVSLYKSFIKAKSELNRNPYSNFNEEDNGVQNRKPLYYFVDKWADLQVVMKKYIEKFHPEFHEERYFITVDKIQGLLGSNEHKEMLESIRKINNELIHNSELPSQERLIETGSKIDLFINKVLEKFDPEEQKDLEKRINRIEAKTS